MTSGPEPVAGPGRPGGARAWLIALAVLVVLLVVALVVLLVIGRDQGSGAAAATSPVPVATATGPTPTTTGPTPTPTRTGAGCPAGGGGVPAGADVRQVVDVDGDGRPDRAWLTADRRFGVTTASGATFSIAIDDASPVPASAIVQLVQPELVPIALVDLTRDAHLYSLAGCAVTAVLNAQGQPYLFDRQLLRGQGTGVGCTQVDGGLRLAGLDAAPAAGGTFDVSRTFVDLDADARHATNGQPETVATGAAADAPVVVTAREVSCGDLVAGRDGPVEPQR
jgi:hypothetical protein